MPTPFPYRDYLKKQELNHEFKKEANESLFHIQLRLTELEKKVNELWVQYCLREKYNVSKKRKYARFKGGKQK